MSLPLSFSDFLFYSSIMEDHAYFLSLGLEGSLKEEALRNYAQWQNLQGRYTPENIQVPLQELKHLKLRILDLLEQGQWIGWLSFSFVEHVLSELVFFENLLRGIRPAPAEEIAQVREWIAEHLASLEDMLDPSEEDYKIAVQAVLEENRSTPANDVQLALGLTLRELREHNELIELVQREKPLSTVHPRLLAHWRREMEQAQRDLLRLEASL